MVEHILHDMHVQSVIDVATVVFSTLILEILSLISLETVPTDQFQELYQLLVPLIGATFASGGMILLNPQPETRNQIVGRSFFGLIFGVPTPHILGWLYEPLHVIALHSILMIPTAALGTMIAFALSKPFVNRLISRSDSAADKIVKAIENKIP